MHHNSQSSSGFTLVELIIFITVVALLSIVAAPTVTSYLARASVSDGKDVAKQIQKALSIRYNQNGAELASTWPDELDLVEVGSVCSATAPCFGGVTTAVFSPQWRKIDRTRYEYRNASLVQVFAYDKQKKSFACVEGDC